MRASGMKWLRQKWYNVSIQTKSLLLMGSMLAAAWVLVALVVVQLRTFSGKSEIIMNEYMDITGFMNTFSAENVCLEAYIRPVQPLNAKEDYLAAIQSTDYTGWSRSKGKELFINWLDASTVEDITATKWIFTHDDEIAMGILEALKSSEIDAEKKDAFLNAGVHLGTSSGLNEIYSVLKGIHQKDYTAEVAKLADLFSVTYDPAMIKAAVDDMVTHIEGGTVTQDHVIAVSVVDATNVNDFQGFGDAVSK